jgi:hypothetical protein
MCRTALADNLVLGRKPIAELAAISPPKGCVDQSPRHRGQDRRADLRPLHK